MTGSRYCPYCGRHMGVRVDEDNATGRRTWSYGCTASGHFRTGGHPSAEAAMTAAARRLH